MTIESLERPLRHVRSFVRRPGRLTPAQDHALTTLLSQYQWRPEDALVNASSEASSDTQWVMEIGFGNGQALVEMAKAQPECRFIGVEVHPPGVGRLLNALHDNAIDNVRVMMVDAVELLTQDIPNQSLAEVRIYFPDPWPKKRHHKRRLIQPDFIALLHSKLKPQGRVHLATDWAPYAEWMVEVFAANTHFERLEGATVWRPSTHFERRGQRRGHSIVDLVYQTKTGDR